MDYEPRPDAPNDGIVNYRLSDEEIEALRRYGEVRYHEAGEILSREGERQIDLCIVLSGQLNIYLPEDGGSRRVGWLEPRQFSGDASVITGQASLAWSQMEEAGEVLHISHDAFHRLLVEHSGLSDVFVTTLVARRAWARSAGRASVVLVGRVYDRETFAIRDLLTKHGVPFLWVDVEKDGKGQVILDRQELTAEDTPLLVTGTTTRLVRPSLEEVSQALGLDLVPDGVCVDVAVVGAGPAGLASSVYAASEGLSVVTLDSSAPGGQAGTSSKIENYLGFPSGISGRELAERATVQAQKFGARMASPATAVALEQGKSGGYSLVLRDGRRIEALSVVLACGAQYRRLPIPDLELYEGSGIYYGATAMEAQLCSNEDVAIVGAGNSAGQGAVFLSKTARAVHVLYRRADIRETMSDYLVRRLEETPNIHLHPESEIDRMIGDGRRLQEISITLKGEPEAMTLKTPFVFLFIGATPCTDWLPDAMAKDAKGFLKTGPEIANLELVRAQWQLDRMPSLYETNWPRVYAVGDIRAGSIKRVASSVGEGSVVVQYIHRALQDARVSEAPTS